MGTWEDCVLGEVVVVSKPASGLEGPAGHDLSPRFLSGSREQSLLVI